VKPKAPKPALKPVTFPVPEIALSAYTLLMQNFQAAANQLGAQAVRAAGLDATEYDYQVDFPNGQIIRGRKIRAAEAVQ
jgi:nitroreductase